MIGEMLGRDLMKWVDRVCVEFDVSKSSTASRVFQEAVDCFCACIIGYDGRRLPLAEAIGAKLNITPSMVGSLSGNPNAVF